jgi:hypothetical protein
VDLDSDPNNCGDCDEVCAAPANAEAYCKSGTCDFECDSGLEECLGECVDTANDPNHCGGCNNTCAAGEGTPRCESGDCSIDCGGGLSPCGTSCVDLSSDPDNCGRCGEGCLAGLLCIGGSCILDL